MRERWLKLTSVALLPLAAAAAPAQPLSTAALQARSLAATCSNCHGSFGLAQGGMKKLAGLSAEQITTAMAAFKAGTQPATVMHQIAKGYSDEQIRLIAGYYANLPAAQSAP